MKLKFTIPILLMVWGFAIQLSAQTGMVKGNVSSTDGFALIGANVSVKGTTVGTITDLDGNYEIRAKAGDVLVFSYVGYEDVESTVGSDLTVNVVLGAGVALQEVVVTALGISREKKALGYAVEQLDADEITRTGQTNLVSALAGKVAGVQIQNTSGAPGAGTDILIRGITSLDPTRSNRPLYIVDGIEISDNTNVLPITPSAGSNAVSSGAQSAFSNRVVDLNPEDIESMTVLKGAQATALYGIRAANGAIVITTKKGKQGKPQVGFYYGQGWENINKTPYIQTKHVDGHFNTSLPRGYDWDTWGARAYEGETYVINDPYQTFFRQGSTRSFGANVSTGNEKYTFRISGDRYNHEGIIPETYWNKTNFGFSGTTQLTDKLHVSASLKYAKTGGNRPHTGDKSILSNLSYVATSADMTSYKTPYTYATNFAAGIIDHPLFLAENNSYVDDVNRYIAGLTMNYKLFKNFGLRYTIGLDNISDARTRVVHKETDEGFQVKGFVIEQNLNESTVTSTLVGEWNFQINKDIKLSGAVGQDLYMNQNKWFSIRGETMVLENFNNLNNATNFFQTNSIVRQRNAGIFGELTSSYQDFLYLTLTARNDWSSTLPKAHNSYFFPSASLSWVISDMMTLPDAFNLIKLRSSYAVVGKDANPYVVGRYYEKAGNFPFGSAVGFTQSTLIGDENLKPEFTNSLEFGFELGMFNNRLGMDIAWYQNNISDMILSVPISNASGAARYVTNAGEIQTSGWEVLLTATPFKYGKFIWDASLNWSTNQGKVVSIEEGIEDIVLFESFGITNKYVRGGKIGDLYGYNYAKSPDGRNVIGSNGLPSVVFDSLTLVGNALPDWIAGLTNSFKYQGLEFSFLWEWKKGGDIFDMGKRNSLRNGQTLETERRNERVLFEGVNKVVGTDGSISYKDNEIWAEITPGGFYRNATYYNQAADVLLEDASWIRLRNISLSYTLPKSLLKNLYIDALSLSFTVNNAYLNTGTLGYDPELNYFGSGSNIYGYTGLVNPATKSYFLKANITF